MRWAILGMFVFGSMLLATPIDLTGNDIGQTVYYHLQTNNGGQTVTPQNGFYLSGTTYVIPLSVTLTGTPLVFPEYSSGTLTSAILTLARTEPEAPIWDLINPAGGTPHNPTLSVTPVAGSLVFTVTSGTASSTFSAGTVDLMTLPAFAAALTSGAGVTVSWTEQYSFTANLQETPYCRNCVEIYQTRAPFAGSVQASLDYIGTGGPEPVPEPLTMLLAGTALAAFGLLGRRVRL